MGLTDEGLPLAVRESKLLVNSDDEHGRDTTSAHFCRLASTKYYCLRHCVYSPVTPLMQAATERGCQTLGGIGMLVHQGAIAFEKWTGVTPCTQTMRQAL